jgi:subtilase family serine protease
MLSAAAYQPMIVVAGPVAAPVTGTKGITPAQTEASAPYTPAQMTTAYGVNLINFNGVTGTGAGQTIAIVDAYNDPDIVSDAATFNTTFNLPQFNVAGGPTLQVLNETGGTTLPTVDGQGWDVEESLDVQWAHSIAPQANIILYEATTNNDSDMDAAVATAAANPAVSVVSMSWGEDEFQGEQLEDPFVLTPTGRTGGVTFLAAAGDWDSPAIYPSFSPDVVSVGGTSLYIQPDGTYISETVWNNDNGYGTGGGISQYEPLPAYQDGLNGINGASTTNRNAPDVAMDADPDTGVYVLDSYSGGWFQVGGTSLATPMYAGLIAIANQGRALNGEPSLNGLTQTLPTLYNLPSSDFNDITTGGNGTYNAAPGYDLVSGLGTPVAQSLVPDLANSNINWSPTASGPSAASTNENTSLDFSGPNAISITDQIAGTNTDTLTLSVNDGSLALGSTDGLTFTSGANDSASMTVSGTIGQLEAAVSGLTYTPNTGYSGSDSLSVLLADPLANVSASTSVALTINAPPTLTAPATGSLSENGSLVFSTGNGNAISVTDVAAGAGSDALTLSVTNGTLTLASTAGLTFTGTNGTASFTVTGAVTALDNALNGLTYQPTPLYIGADTLSLSVTDPADNLSASTSVALTISALPAPTITAPTTASLSEDGSLVFSTGNGNAISVTDSGAGSNPDSLTLSVSHGTLTLVSTAGLTFTGTNGTASFTVSGTVASLDAALNGLTYQPKAGYIGSDSLAVSVADAADELSASTSVALTVNILPPGITAPATASLTENGSLVFSSSNGNAISFTDVNAGTAKTESLSLSVTDGTLTLGSTTGLTYTSGKNKSASLTVTGTVANLNAALSGLTYKPTAAYWGSDSLAITVTDPGDKQSSSTSVALTVNAISPPSISAPGAASVGEDLSVTFSTANGNAISVADPNTATTGDTLTLSVTNGTLTLGSTPGLTFKSGKNGTASFSFAATLANLNKALNGLTYTPTTGYSGPDTLSISISDSGDGQSGSNSVALTVNPATAPAITAPGSASLSENGSQVFSTTNGNAISFTDANAGTIKTESLTLSVSHGTLKLDTTYGLTVTAGANNSASMTVRGTVTNLNAALNGLTYKPTTGYSGPDSLAISVADPPDSLSASSSVVLTVITTPPAFTAPATASVAENGSLVFSKANSDMISVADVNAGSAVEQLTLTATNGKLKLGSTSGITFSSGANSSSSMTLTGTLTNLNNAIKTLTFTPTTGYTGSATIALGYTDVGNGLTASANIAVTVGTSAAVATGPSGSVSPSSLTTTSSSDDGTTDSDTQWAGFSAALETLNS